MTVYDEQPTPSDSAMTAERLAAIYDAWCDSTFTLDLQPLGFDHIKQGAAMLRALDEEVGRLAGRLCLVCGAKEPCKDAPDACTFDPSPIEAAQAFHRRAITAEAERTKLAADLARVTSERDALRVEKRQLMQALARFTGAA